MDQMNPIKSSASLQSMDNPLSTEDAHSFFDNLSAQSQHSPHMSESLPVQSQTSLDIADLQTHIADPYTTHTDGAHTSQYSRTQSLTEGAHIETYTDPFSHTQGLSGGAHMGQYSRTQSLTESAHMKIYPDPSAHIETYTDQSAHIETYTDPYSHTQGAHMDQSADTAPYTDPYSRTQTILESAHIETYTDPFSRTQGAHTETVTEEISLASTQNLVGLAPGENELYDSSIPLTPMYDPLSGAVQISLGPDRGPISTEGGPNSAEGAVQISPCPDRGPISTEDAPGMTEAVLSTTTTTGAGITGGAPGMTRDALGTTTGAAPGITGVPGSTGDAPGITEAALGTISATTTTEAILGSTEDALGITEGSIGTTEDAPGTISATITTTTTGAALGSTGDAPSTISATISGENTIHTIHSGATGPSTIPATISATTSATSGETKQNETVLKPSETVLKASETKSFETVPQKPMRGQKVSLSGVSKNENISGTPNIAGNITGTPQKAGNISGTPQNITGNTGTPNIAGNMARNPPNFMGNTGNITGNTGNITGTSHNTRNIPNFSNITGTPPRHPQSFQNLPGPGNLSGNLSNLPGNPGNITGGLICTENTMLNPVYMSPSDSSFNISNVIPSPDSFLTPATEQDVFTASLLSSDADRRHDAWIPKESTRRALIHLATSPPPGTYLDKELLTMPGIAVKEDFGDPVKNLVRTYLGEAEAAKRNVLNASSVTQDDRGLRQLISCGCYHSAVNLTTQLLSVYGQGEGRVQQHSKHTAHSIQLWFTRIALLIKLRRFSLAEVECQAFGDLDSPDLYFEFYPELYGGRKGSMVPFAFRLLVAELPQHLGKHTHALDRLSALLNTCNQIIKNLGSGLSEDGSQMEMTVNMRDDSLKLWKTRRQRVLYSITTCAVNLKDFRLAGNFLQKLIAEDPNSAAGLYSALGRLCLQLGDVSAAQETFNQHLEHSPPPPHHDPVQGLLHSAYIAIAQNAFQDAVDILQQASKINPNNGLVLNNLGVCLMYTGQVTEAINLMESFMFSQPDRFLHEALVLNVCTMYELQSSNAHTKKLKLLSLISQHKGDSFNVSALKLQP